MKRRGTRWTIAAAGLVGVLALVAAGCGGGGGGSSVTALPSSSCEDMQYKGDGDPDVLIASDLVRQGADAPQNTQIINAILYILDANKWKAGDHNVAFQSCDDSTAQAGKWDSGKCSQNAQAYAGNDSLWTVIGTFNSGCAAIIIPVLNQVSDGGIGMVSPANTFLCLTVKAPICEPGEPDKYYPAGFRNYVRVVVDDSWQGAAQATLMQQQGIKSVYILNDKEPYGQGVAENLQAAVKSLGIEVKGFEAYDPKQSNYEALMQKIGKTGAEAIFVGGLLSENGAQVIKDKVAVLGPNDGDVGLFVPDGFVLQNTIDEAGSAAKGMYGTVAGKPPSELGPEGQAFVAGFKKTLGGKPIDPYAIYGAAAAQVTLKAIADADKRGDVITNLFATDIPDSVLGPVKFNEQGDRATSPVTVYLAGTEFAPIKAIEPAVSLVAAARGISK